jgi:acetylornithine deacetylase
MAHPRLPETVELLGELIAFPSVSSDSNLDLIAWLADRLGNCGAHVQLTTDPSGHKANLFATLGPEVDGGIVLSGHTDVVPVDGQAWSLDPFAMEERAGRLYGRGACDMKGFLAACLAVAPDLAEAVGDRPVHFAFTYDEEVGCIGGRQLMAELQRRELRPAMAVIGEPTEMKVVEGHKGCCEYSTHFTGLAGHGSDPDRGVNAVDYAVRYVARLHALRDRLKARAPAEARFAPPWTTVNVGALEGGVAHNVIAGKARVDWEMRPVQAGDREFVLSDLADHVARDLLPEMRAVSPEAGITTEVVGEVAGLEPMAANAARDLVAQLTGENGAGTVAFGTEAGLYQAAGIPAVVCGPGAIAQAHKPDEYVGLDQLDLCLGMLARLAGRL